MSAGFARDAVGLRGSARVPQRCADRRPGGVDAGDHQQDHRAPDVLRRQFVAIELGREEEARQVLARLGQVLFDARRDVGLELALLDLGLTLFGRLVDVFEDHADEAAEDVRVFLREAEHLHDHLQGNVLGVLGGRVERVSACHGREKVVAKRAV